MGLTFSKQGGMKGMKLGKIMSVGDMPFHFYVDADGDQVALPCTDRLLTMKLAERVTTQRFMPMLSVKGQPEIRLGSWVSLGGQDLAGPWAPADAPAPEPQPEPEPVDEDADADEDSLASEIEADDEASDDDDTDDDTGDEDLDALLSSLTDDDDDDDADESEDEMDPELAALLADL